MSKRIGVTAVLLHTLSWWGIAMRTLSTLMSSGVLALLLCTDAPAQRFGQPAPAITLEHAFQGPNSEDITLESLRGKLVVLEFWTTW